MVFVGFSTPKRWNPLSAAIRWATRFPASHAWLLVDDPTFRMRLVLEAHSTGFRVVTLERFAKENRVVAIVRPGAPLDAGLPAAGRWFGEEFDARGLVGLGIELARRMLGLRRRRNRFRSAQALFCSEAVVKTLKAAAHPRAVELGDEDETPADVFRFLLRTGGETVRPRRLNLKPRQRPPEGNEVPEFDAPEAA